jgi:hypothetical protein
MRGNDQAHVFGPTAGAGEGATDNIPAPTAVGWARIHDHDPFSQQKVALRRVLSGYHPKDCPLFFHT